MNDCQGLTVIEILTVLCIISVISTIVISRSIQDPARLMARAESIKSHIRYAQARAINTNSTWGLRCNPAGDRYWLFQYEGGAETLVRLPGEGGDAIDLSVEKTTLAGFTIIAFNAWGRPCLDVTGINPGGASGSVNSEGQSIGITVTPETGFVP